ncbi:tyrosine-type recombinase/integrase [Priestia abyssalis]|uniref:tyrosine-type recombinase/integrase n=1 Tax=Priestia abyssalis TaxID=1221450 RepID=UPI000995391C|nr:tyrosine-type recombinase/integrase [Priestia abyssalis]
MLFEINILESNKNSRKISINGHEFSVQFSTTMIEQELPGILDDIGTYLVTKNISGLFSIFNKYKLLNLFFFRCMEMLYQKEFEEYLLYICDYFVEELNQSVFSHKALIQFLMTNDTESAFKYKAIRREYLTVTSTPQIVIEKYFNNKFEEFISACKVNDLQLVRKVSPCLGDQSLINRIYENEDCVKIFESFVKKVGESLIEDGQALSATEITRYIFSGDTTKKGNGNRFNKLHRLEIFRGVALEVYTAIANKDNSYKFSDDVWILREKNEQGFHTYTFDFSDLPEPNKTYLKSYINEILQKTPESIGVAQSRHRSIKHVLLHFEELPYKNVKSVLQMNYQHISHLFTYFQQIQQDGKRKYALPTIYGFFTYMRPFVDWLLEEKQLNRDNPFKRLVIKNIKSFSESIEYIPETVVEQLENVLHELPQMLQNAWTIMMNTGMRFSDIPLLDENCIKYDKEIQSYILTYLNVKSEKKRIQGGQSRDHKIPVSEAVVFAVESQKELTADLRLLAGTMKIFITHNGLAVIPLEGRSLARPINRLIKKHNIRDANGEVYHYTNHQCRKTLIAELFSRELTLRQVADFIGQHEQTTARSYRDVQKKKIAQLDNEMFEQLFEEIIDEEVKDQYTEEEKKALYKEIKLGARETPEGHGTCVKHVSFGPCHKKKCVGCKMLVTGPQKLPKWYRLYKEQQRYVEDLVTELKQADVENYEEHRSYQQEIHLLNVYKETIEKVEKFAKERKIPIEQYKESVTTD